MLLAGATRLELATSGVTGRRSNQTELRPLFYTASSETLRDENRTGDLPAPDEIWWAEQGLNL